MRASSLPSRRWVFGERYLRHLLRKFVAHYLSSSRVRDVRYHEKTSPAAPAYSTECVLAFCFCTRVLSTQPPPSAMYIPTRFVARARRLWMSIC